MTLKASELQRGDVINFAAERLRIEETPTRVGGRIKIRARSSEGGCPLVNRNYPATMILNVDRAGDTPVPCGEGVTP